MTLKVIPRLQAFSSAIRRTFCSILPDFNRQRARAVPQRQLGFLYRASYALRGICHGHVSVCLSVCLSQVGVLLKWLNIGTRKQRRTIAQVL